MNGVSSKINFVMSSQNNTDLRKQITDMEKLNETITLIYFSKNQEKNNAIVLLSVLKEKK
jgi:uncharacterized protein YeaO (DUF488 family)